MNFRTMTEASMFSRFIAVSVGRLSETGIRHYRESGSCALL